MQRPSSPPGHPPAGATSRRTPPGCTLGAASATPKATTSEHLTTISRSADASTPCRHEPGDPPVVAWRGDPAGRRQQARPRRRAGVDVQRRGDADRNGTERSAGVSSRARILVVADPASAAEVLDATAEQLRNTSARCRSGSGAPRPVRDCPRRRRSAISWAPRPRGVRPRELPRSRIGGTGLVPSPPPPRCQRPWQSPDRRRAFVTRKTVEFHLLKRLPQARSRRTGRTTKPAPGLRLVTPGNVIVGVWRWRPRWFPCSANARVSTIPTARCRGSTSCSFDSYLDSWARLSGWWGGLSRCCQFVADGPEGSTWPGLWRRRAGRDVEHAHHHGEDHDPADEEDEDEHHAGLPSRRSMVGAPGRGRSWRCMWGSWGWLRSG